MSIGGDGRWVKSSDSIDSLTNASSLMCARTSKVRRNKSRSDQACVHSFSWSKMGHDGPLEEEKKKTKETGLGLP